MIVVSEVHHGAAAYFRELPSKVILNGVDTDLYPPLGAGRGAPPGPPRILFVGRFDTRNGLDTMLQAAGILRDEGRTSSCRWSGTGRAGRGTARRWSWALTDRVEWLGEQDAERPRLYREADVFAAPLHDRVVRRPFLLEALSCERHPVVCADNIGFNQVIRDGMPGVSTPPTTRGAWPPASRS